MPIVPRSVYRALEGHLRRRLLAERARRVIINDRYAAIEAGTGWHPPRGITAGTLPGQTGRHVVGKGGRDASR
ncbi:hypothetical protein [Halomonas sp. SL1]|uniref:hypothetical protein n=1 Tax=Halomonas sp. SL1 TaxID=2137478 RepID=UPI000D169600|nr:hypothetical protein [Halomonas sp. SL1]RAH37446.1 hypothetical protein C9J49_011125 [Halomonas sp. SL1]